MWGAIIGDIIGSTFEFENHRSPYFELFRKDARFTDDTVCTVAVADMLQQAFASEEETSLDSQWASNQLRLWCCSYLNRGFGSMFYQWLANGVNRPYNSYGNGSLMRISPVAFYGVQKGWTLPKTLQVAMDITNLTHNHPLAQNSVACYVTILYRLLKEKPDVQGAKELISNTLMNHQFEAPLAIAHYRTNITFDVTAPTSLLVACAGILESSSLEEVFHLVVSAGGDSDTYCAIAGAMAEAIWPMPKELLAQVKPYFKEYDQDLLSVMEKLYLQKSLTI